MQATASTLNFRCGVKPSLNCSRAQALISNTQDGGIPLRLNEQTGKLILQAKLNPAYSLGYTYTKHPELFQKSKFLQDLLVAITNSLGLLSAKGLSIDLNLLNTDTVEIYEAQLGLRCRLLCLPIDTFELQLPAQFINSTPLKQFLFEKIYMENPKDQRRWQNLLSRWWNAIEKADYITAEKLLMAGFDRQKIVNKKNKAKTKSKPSTKKSKKVESQLSLLKQIKQKIQNNDLPFERTIPISPEQADFRVALLSEFQPGSEQEDFGTRVFILVDEFIVGRDRFVCDLVLEELTISRRHARILRYGRNFFIEDLGSDNSTYVDGHKLKKFEEFLLEDHCRIQFGDRTFFFSVDD